MMAHPFPTFGRWFRALGRAIRKTWKPVIVTLLAINAVVTTSNYLERKYLPPPLISAPIWQAGRYQHPRNPYRHYEAAVRLLPDTDSGLFGRYFQHRAMGRRLVERDEKALTEADIRRYLENAQPAIRELIAGAQCPVKYFQYIRKSPSQDELLFLELSELRTLAETTLLDVENKMADGRQREALEEVLAVAEMGSDITHGGPVITASMGVWTKLRAFRALHSMLATTKLSSRDYRMIAAELARICRETEPITEATRREYAFSRNFLEEIVWAGWRETLSLLAGDPKPNRLWLFLYKSVPGMKARILTRFDRAWVAAVNNYARPYPEVAAADEQELLARLDPYSRILFPVFHRAAGRYALDVALNQGVILTAALEAYRLEHGRYPETLETLVPDYISQVPVDPFTTGQPFVYSETGDKYLLYSVGLNMTDDGGKVFSLRDLSTDKPGDLVFGPGVDLLPQR